MSCAEAKGTIRAEGAVILNFRSKFNPSIPRYGRFVADQRFCASSELAEITYIPTADTKSCPVRECHPARFRRRFSVAAPLRRAFVNHKLKALCPARQRALNVKSAEIARTRTPSGRPAAARA